MLLAIDTSTIRIGIALYDGTDVPGEFTWRSGFNHTVELAPAVNELLKRVDIKIQTVTAVGVALGPGSFTSLRVGLAFAKGLVLARGISIIGISTLDIVAASVPVTDRRLAAVVPAGRSRLAMSWYVAGEKEWQTDGSVVVTTADEMADKIRKPVLVCGEMSADDRHRLARKYKNVTLASPAQCVRRPGILAELAWQKWQAGKIDSAAALAPIYLHVAGGPPA